MGGDKKLVPRLRFPEFIDDWITKKVEEIAPLQRGFDLPVSQIRPGPYPVVFSNGILKTHAEVRSKGPGVVTGRSGTIGKVTFVEEDFWPHNTSLWVTNFNGNAPKYIYYFYVNFRLERFGTGSGVPTLNRNDIHCQRKSIPTLPEQQKIASFLGAVDEKIQQLRQKKTLLEQYKKGVMQKLFPKKAGQSPELRFKRADSSNYPDWEEKRLGEVAANIGYGMNSAAKPFDGLNKYLRITDIEDSSNAFDETKLTSPDGELEHKYKVLLGDILFARTGASVGKSYLHNSNDDTVYFAGFLIRFSIIKGVASFIFYQTLTYRYHKWVNVMSMRSGQPGVNAEEYKSFIVFYPSKEEQQKIASFLSQIDQKINQVTTQIDQTQTFKKGLLQQMFV